MNRHINSKKKSHFILAEGMPGTSALDVTVDAYKVKRETLARIEANADLSFPEGAPVKAHLLMGKQK